MDVGAACFLAAGVASAFPQDKKGCEGVQYSKRPSAEYSPAKLRQRIKQDPSDVDALVNLGTRLEEEDQLADAEALYERAIKAKPDCYLGYYFSGLASETISTDTASDAEIKIRKALSLNPSLQKDPNIQGFFKRHAKPALPMEKEPLSLAKQLLIGADRFYVGVGVGIFVAALALYLSKSTRAARFGT